MTAPLPCTRKRTGEPAIVALDRDRPVAVAATRATRTRNGSGRTTRVVRPESVRGESTADQVNPVTRP
ncbi:hypothetical protein EF879_17480 [Micromonospora sp. HM5-17]|nr:hypothetical protein EF879_17480 [Micromonospora sp. HM5-17]